MMNVPMRSTEAAPPPNAPSAWFGVLALAGALGASACGGPIGTTDASRADASTDAPGVPPARVSLHLSVDLEALEDDTVLDHAVLGLAAIHAPYDRGRLEAVPAQAYELVGGPVEIMLTDATPGVYAEIELDLAEGAWGPALLVELREPERHIRVELGGAFRIEGRCDVPLELGAGATLTLDARVDMAAVAHVLRERELPAPIDGLIVVDERSAPAVVSEIRSALRRFSVDCDDDEG